MEHESISDMEVSSSANPLSVMTIQIEKADIHIVHLENKLRRLDYKYSKLLHKPQPTYEEMNDLLEELRLVTRMQGLNRVENYQALIKSIKDKVIKLQESGKLIKVSRKEIKRVSGLNLAVQLMKSNALEGYYSDDEEEVHDHNKYE
jgi:hypothetical protein